MDDNKKNIIYPFGIKPIQIDPKELKKEKHVSREDFAKKAGVSDDAKKKKISIFKK